MCEASHRIDGQGDATLGDSSIDTESTMAKDLTISFRMQPPLAERLEAFRTWLESEPNTLTRSDALNTLIASAVLEDGTPAFTLRTFDDDPSPRVRAWRRRMRNDNRRTVTCSFRASNEIGDKLDMIAHWFAARAIVEVSVDRGVAIRTLILQGITAEGTPRFRLVGDEEEDLTSSGSILPISTEAMLLEPEDEGFDPPTRRRGDSGTFDVLPLHRITEKP